MTDQSEQEAISRIDREQNVIYCFAFDRGSKYEYRQVRLLGIPHVGQILKLSRDGMEPRDFQIEAVQHIDCEGERAKLELYIRETQF